MDLFSLRLNQWPQFGVSEVRGHRVNSVQQERKLKTKKQKMKTNTFEASPGTSREEKGKTSSSLTSTRFPDVVAGGQRSKTKVQGCGGFPRTRSRSARRAFLLESGSGGAVAQCRRWEVVFARRSSATLAAAKKMPPASTIVDGKTSWRVNLRRSLGLDLSSFLLFFQEKRIISRRSLD